MSGVNGGVILAPTGLDGFAKHMMVGAATEAGRKIMVRGRQCYVLVLASDGPHASMARWSQVADPATALGYAEMLEAEAQRIREVVRKKAFSELAGSA